MAKETVDTEIEASEAEFQINEFAAACSMAKEKSNGKPNFRKVESGPLLNAQGVSFKVIVDWFVHENGSPNPARNLGAYLEVFNPKQRRCKVRKRLVIVNRDPGNSCVQEDLFFEPFITGRQGWSSALGPTVKGLSLTLGDLFEPDLGWLQQGALVVQARVEVIDMQKGSKTARTEKVEALRDGSRDVCESFKALLASGDRADVTIQVDTEQLKAHSQVLAARSPFFQRLLKKGLEVSINDLTLETMKAVLSFIYTGSLERAVVENQYLLQSLLKAAPRFQIPGLALCCAKSLIPKIAATNVVSLLELAESLQCGELQVACAKFLRQNEELLNSEKFQQLVLRKPQVAQEVTGKRRRLL